MVSIIPMNEKILPDGTNWGKSKYCVFCESRGEKVEMGNMCPKCLAYRVTPETYDLPMHKQPWYDEEEARKLKRAINVAELKKQKGDNIATTKLNQE
jgi:hypothetical protein